MLVCLTFFGCAQRPWTDPLEERQAENALHFLEQLKTRTESCPEGIDGDISLSYQSPFDAKKVQGYFQILSPSYLKLVISTPLGQPVIILTSDQQTFQLINTLERRYTAGNVHSYALLHNIPPALLTGEWKNWIRGTFSIIPSAITAIRQDREQRGTWFSLQKQTDNVQQETHLLIESREGKLLSRIIESNTGEPVMKIVYQDWISLGSCKQPRIIKMTGLKYNTELTMTLSDVLIAENLSKNDFKFSAPASYTRQILP